MHKTERDVGADEKQLNAQLKALLDLHEKVRRGWGEGGGAGKVERDVGADEKQLNAQLKALLEKVRARTGERGKGEECVEQGQKKSS